MWYSVGQTGDVQRCEFPYLVIGKEVFIWGKVRCIMCGKKEIRGTFLVVQWLDSALPRLGFPGSTPGQGTRFHVLRL